MDMAGLDLFYVQIKIWNFGLIQNPKDCNKKKALSGPIDFDSPWAFRTTYVEIFTYRTYKNINNVYRTKTKTMRI